MSGSKIVFVTGTDTGVGKTLLSALLLQHLRQRGIHALAIKPFCSGGRADVRLLQSAQPGELSDDEANPFYFRKPLAPLVAGGKKIRLAEVLASIRHVEKKCDRLIVEGSGGLLVPLGEGYMVADLIARLDCRVVVAARNRLGTINHTLLTLRALEAMGIKGKRVDIVLMSQRNMDLSGRTNLRVLRDLAQPVRVHSMPFLGSVTDGQGVKRSYFQARTALQKIAGLGPQTGWECACNTLHDNAL
jgi:dethiobiotin synthetase